MSKVKFTQEIYNVVAESGNFHYRVVPAWTDHIISDEEAKANEKLFLNAPKMYRDINSLILSITSHPDYMSGCENDEWHTLVSLAQSTLEKAN